MALNPITVSLKEAEEERTQRQRPYEDGSRDRRDAAISQGMLGAPEVRRGPGFSPRASRGSGCLFPGCWASTCGEDGMKMPPLKGGGDSGIGKSTGVFWSETRAL